MTKFESMTNEEFRKVALDFVQSYGLTFVDGENVTIGVYKFTKATTGEPFVEVTFRPQNKGLPLTVVIEDHDGRAPLRGAMYFERN